MINIIPPPSTDKLELPLPNGQSLNRSKLLDTQSSPKSSKHLGSHDRIDCFSPSIRQNFIKRKSALFPHGLTQESAFCAISPTKYERTRAEATMLYETIKDFPFIRMLCEPHDEEGEIDLDSIIDLIMNIKVKKSESGDIIYSQDDTSDGKIYLIFEGEVALVIKDPDHITAKNYERFESEQKKRTIMRLGSFKKGSAPPLREQSSGEDSGKRSEQTSPRQEEDSGDQSDHEFGLLKSYMTSNFIPHKNVRAQAEDNGGDGSPENNEVVDKDLARVSGVTRAFCRFKKVLKQRNQVLNTAKGYGIVRDKLEIGQYFGGNDSKLRDETAFVLKDTELLVIEHKDLQQLKTNFAKKKIALKNFMLDSFPKLDLYQSEKIITGLLGTLEEKSYEGNAQIVTEGQPGEYFYLIQSGTCEVSKEFIITEGHALDHVMAQSRSLLRVQPSTRKRAVLTSISKGAFFGDELVFQAQKYCFSVKVTSLKANIIAIKNKTFAARFPQIVFESLKTLYQNKSLHYLEIVKSLLTSVQYENFELDCEQAVMSPDDKKAALDSMTVKDLWNPIKLRSSKKKSKANTLYQSESNSSRRNTAASTSFENQTSFTPKGVSTLPPLRDLKEARKSDFSLNYSPSLSKDSGKRESQEKLKVFLDKTYQGETRGKPYSVEPSSRGKSNRDSILSNDSANEMYSPKVVLSKFASGSIQTKEEDLEKMKDTLRARTSVHKSVSNGKDYISSIKNGHSKYKPLNAGEIDTRLEKNASASRFTPTSLETPDTKKQLTVKRVASQPRMYLDFNKAANNGDREDLGQEEFKTGYELPQLHMWQPHLKKMQNKFKVDVSLSFGDDLSLGVGSAMPTMELKTSNPGSALIKKDNLSSSLLLVKNQSFSPLCKPFGKEINPLDVQLPRNINAYIAEKKHLKLKEKMFPGVDNDDTEEYSQGSIYLGPGTPKLPKRDSSTEIRNKGYESENSEHVVRTSQKMSSYKTVKQSRLSNVEVQRGEQEETEDVGKQNEKGKKNGGIAWQGNQSLMLNKKGKMYKQLTKKGELKKIFPYLPDPNLNVNNSLILNKAI